MIVKTSAMFAQILGSMFAGAPIVLTIMCKMAILMIATAVETPKKLSASFPNISFFFSSNDQYLFQKKLFVTVIIKDMTKNISNIRPVEILVRKIKRL